MLSEEEAIYTRYLDLLDSKRIAGRGDPLPANWDILARHYENFLFDGFGTLYNYGVAHTGAVELIEWLRSKGRNVRLLTNAASRPAAHLAQELASLGFTFTPDEIITSGELLPLLNIKLKIRQAFSLGRESSEPLLHAAGIEPVEDPEPAVVVLSVSTAENDPRLEKARQILTRPNALLVVLNPDAWAPKPDGTRLAVAGTQAEQLRQATGCRTLYLGKPFKLIYEVALRSLIPSRGAVLMVGDTLGTDMAGAKISGIDCALLLGGNTREYELREDCYRLRIRPDYLLRSLEIPKEENF